jgi:Protein of unknown function (DUF3014)
MKQEILWVLGALVLAGLGTYFYYQRKDAALEPQQDVQVQEPGGAQAPKIENPVPAPEPEAPPLPKLKESDPAVRDALTVVVGDQAVAKYLVPQEVIRRFVVTVDNLPRKKVAVELRPVKAVPGEFVASGGADSVVLDDENYARYAPLIKIVQSADSKQLAALYRRFYPLFQESYENLGYPSAYFNDRLVQVIDHLLETPDIKGQVRLVQPSVYYQFADPQLESLSAGQKALLRMGSGNAAAVKAKLKELRAEIAKTPPPNAP